MTNTPCGEEHLKVWQYPDVDSTVSGQEAEEVLPVSPEGDLSALELGDEQEGEAPPSVAAESDLTQQMAYLDALAQRLNERIADIDQTFILKITQIIKKAVKKIILKELEVDDARLQQMLEEALTHMKSLEAAQLWVSEQDYALFETYGPAQRLQVKVDPKLAPGDFIIKSADQVLESILDDRLNQLFGVADD